MSQRSDQGKHEDNESFGPRPPVPGEESCARKMTEGVSLLDSAKNSPPSYLNWARTLNHLLEDRDGVELFKKYVEEEAPDYNDHLNFYFACEGLKQQTDPEKVNQIIGAIYRFLRKSQFSISEDLRQTIKAGLKNEIPLSSKIYDSMQQHVENIIRDKIYPTFLCSEMYIAYIQQMSKAQEQFSGVADSGSSSSFIVSSRGLVAPTTSSSISSLKNQSAAAIVSSVAALGSSSARGSFYAPSTSASSSGSVSATDTLPRSSTLPTLHEDTELSLYDDFGKLRIERDRLSSDIPMRLTRDLLLATQKRRLEMRPPGAHGYVYTANINTSYIPNSRVDSEKSSVSSGGRTDSDTMSLSSCSMDGRPYIQRRQSSLDSKAIRQSALANKETNVFQVIPRTQRLHSDEHRPLKEAELIALLIPKLEEVKRKQDLEAKARLEHFPYEPLSPSEHLPGDRTFADAIREKFSVDEDNDQDILDQHVSRVWSDQTPRRSPKSMSPCPPIPSRRRTTTVDSGLLSEISVGSSMKHSKSMSDHSSSSRKLTNKWPSMNTDSGISLFSADTVVKYKDTSSRSSLSTVSKLEEAKRRLEDEARRSPRHLQHQFPSMQVHSVSSSSVRFPPTKAQETTTVVFTFCDEEYPYRSKIPGVQVTLKQFKEYLPKKGNFRFFFKTHYDDPDSPVIQEEIINDSDILPLFEGKVMGLVKPSD